MDDIVKDLDCLKNGIISKDDVGTKLVNAAKGAADVLVEPSTPNSSYGGFLPVMDVIKAVLKTGWNGPWSYEVRLTPGSMTQESCDTLDLGVLSVRNGAS